MLRINLLISDINRITMEQPLSEFNKAVEKNNFSSGYLHLIPKG